MNEVVIEIVKCVVMAAAAGAAYMIRRDLIPFIQSKMNAQQLKTARDMADVFVYMADQVFGDKSGDERKKIVTDALKNALRQSGIDMTDQFIDDVIEAAVKGLRIAESGGVVEVETAITADDGRSD